MLWSQQNCRQHVPTWSWKVWFLPYVTQRWTYKWPWRAYKAEWDIHLRPLYAQADISKPNHLVQNHLKIWEDWWLLFDHTRITCRFSYIYKCHHEHLPTMRMTTKVLRRKPNEIEIETLDPSYCLVCASSVGISSNLFEEETPHRRKILLTHKRKYEEMQLT